MARGEKKHHQKRRRHKGAPRIVAAPPGTLTGAPDAHPTSARIIAYGADSVSEHAFTDHAALQRLRNSHSVTWVDVTGLSDTAFLQRLGEGFGLHPLALEDVLSASQRPKAESYEGHMFLVLLMPSRSDVLELEQVSIFFGKGFVISFQERPGDCFGRIRERLRAPAGRMRGAGADYLAYALADAIADSYFPVLETLGDELEVLEDEIITRPRPENARTLHGLKRDLLQLRRAIWPMRELFNTLMRDDDSHVGRETKVFLRDSYDHSVQLMDIVETYREMASGLLDVYLSSMSQRMNEVMKVLTVISTIFIPLGFLAGVWGMNFQFMPELGWAYGYPLALSLMATIAALLIWYFWRKGWLGE